MRLALDDHGRIIAPKIEFVHLRPATLTHFDGEVWPYHDATAGKHVRRDPFKRASDVRVAGCADPLKVCFAAQTRIGIST